jgi:DNA polymerase V
MNERESQPDGVSIHAGFPNPAADKNLVSLDFNQLLIRRATSTFLFRIQGTSGEAFGIFDGDIAIVDRALDPRKADLVVWWDDDTFCISRYDTLDQDTTVWGVITSTVRQLRKNTE